MEYLLLALSAVCVALQFCSSKLYQKKIGGMTGVLFFPFCTALAAMLFFLCLAGFRLSFSAYSFGMAAAVALLMTGCNVLNAVVFAFGKLSVYTVFVMLGGMLMPYLYGVCFLHEQPTAAQIAGIFVLILAVVLSIDFSKTEEGGSRRRKAVFYTMCVGVFALNGTIAGLSKIHQVNAAAVDTNSFLTYMYMFSMCLAGLILLGRILYAKFRPENSGAADIAPDGDAAGRPTKRDFTGSRWKAVVLSVAFALTSGVGYWLQLLVAKTVPAVALYPIVTGGSIVLTALAGLLFYRERIKPMMWVSLAVTVAGTVLFLF